MADYQIFTPPREPTTEELVSYKVFESLKEDGTVLARIRCIAKKISVELKFIEPSISVRYDLLKNQWINSTGDLIDISELDLTIPEEIVSSATIKTPYFDLIAFKKGTTDCKLAAVNDAKVLIRNAIINKGIDVPSETKFRGYSHKINQIEVGSGLKFIDSFVEFVKESTAGKTCFVFVYLSGKQMVVFDFSSAVTYKSQRITWNSQTDYVLACGQQLGTFFIGTCPKDADESQVNWITQHIIATNTEPSILVPGYTLKYAVL